MKEYLQNLEERNIYYNIETLPEIIKRNIKVNKKQQEEKYSSKVKLYEENLYENKRFIKQIHNYQKIDIENQKINQDNLCLKCKTHKIDVILIPCGHAVVCYSCSNSKCFFCKETVYSLASIQLINPIQKFNQILYNHHQNYIPLLAKAPNKPKDQFKSFNKDSKKTYR